MKPTTEELAEVVLTLTRVMASVLEMNTRLAEIVVPLAQHLNEAQKQDVLSEFSGLNGTVLRLRNVCEKLRTQEESTSAAETGQENSPEGSSAAIAVAVGDDELKTQAEAGNAEAQFRTGELLRHRAEEINGSETAQASAQRCEQDAASWYRKAAEQGFAPAQRELANMYMYCEGIGVGEDKQEQAFCWCRKAAAQGDSEAQFELASWLEDDKPAEAISLYRQAAEHGRTDALLSLAHLFESGCSVPKNDGEAFSCFLKAAEVGDADAYTHLGRKYLLGEGTPKNCARAVHWLLKVGNPQNTTAFYDMGLAQVMLGLAYASDENPERDLIESYKWLNLAVAYRAGNPDELQQLTAKRDEIANAMTRDQIEEAQRRSAELFVSEGAISERIRNETTGPEQT